MSKEIWKDIIEYPGYQVSNMGNIRSIKKGKTPLKPYNSKGYRCVDLSVNGKITKHVSVHRLVGKYFVDNPDKKPFINHKDGVRHNNKATNLQWVTAQENNIHAVNTGLKGPYCRKRLTVTNVHLIVKGELCGNWDSVEEMLKHLTKLPE